MLAAIRRRRHQSRRAVTAIEYGIIAAAIIVAIIGALRVTGTNLEAVFGQVGDTMANIVKPATASSAPAFSTFTALYKVPDNTFCGTSGVYGFVGPGGVISNNQCVLSQSESAEYADITSSTSSPGYVFIQGTSSGGPAVMPPVKGPGTGFSVLSGQIIVLFKQQAGNGLSFAVAGSTAFSPSQVTSIGAACSAQGGTLLNDLYGGYKCQAPYYTVAQIASLLPPGG